MGRYRHTHTAMRFCLIAIYAATLLSVLPTPVRADGVTITVNDTGDDFMVANTRKCTLRSAISTINAGMPRGRCQMPSGGAGDQIAFALMGTGTINISVSLPMLTRGMTIAGSTQTGYAVGGTPFIIIAGTESFPIFTVDTLPQNESVTLDALTITKGKAADCGTPGGGIVNRGQLTITRSIITDNFGCAGSGIGNSGTLIVENSAITGNSIVPTGSPLAAQFGAGLYTSGGTVTLTNVSLTGNVALSDGAAIYAAAPVVLVNATLTNNTAGGTGGGLHANLASGTVSLIHTTVTSNGAMDGGGLYRTGMGTVTLSRTAVAGNRSTASGGAVDVRGTFAGDAYNLIGIADGGTGFSGSDRSGTAAQSLGASLLTLGDYGGSGPISTAPPRPDSLLVDAAPCLTSPVTDARGVARTQGLRCDIGAVELRHVPVMATGTTPIQGALAALPANDGSAILDLAAGTYTERVTLPGAPAVALSGAGPGATILDGSSVGSSGPVVTATAAGGFAMLHSLTIQNGAGGVSNTGGTLSLSECVVRGHAGAVAAITNATSGIFTLTNCTVTANTRGGITNDGTMTITNSTISGNSATGAGRAAAITNGAGNGGMGASLRLVSSTVASNGANGVANTAGMLTVIASILTDGTTGAITDGGGNVLLPVDAKLLPLTLNVPGVTPTHALGPNSPAIDAAGACPAGVMADQISTSRPRGAACDSGAFEYIPVTPTINATTAPRAGGSIVFSGSGFQRGTSLVVGGTNAMVSSIGDDGTTLTATVPPHMAGGVSVVATNPVGLASSAATLTYLPGAAASFTVVGPTGTVQAGMAQQITVTARDSDGSIATGYRGIVRLRLMGDVTDLLTYTFMASDSGVHAFSITFAAVRNVPLIVTDSATAAITGMSGNITVAPGVAAVSPHSGPTSGGTQLTVNGAGFVMGGTAVRVGGTLMLDADVTFVSATVLRVRMPAHAAGGVDLAITVNGQTTTVPNAFTYGVIVPVATPRPTTARATPTPLPAPAPRPSAPPPR